MLQSSSSLALLELCLRTRWDPHVERVRHLVMAGADVVSKHVISRATREEMDEEDNDNGEVEIALLHQLIQCGKKEAVLACLESPLALDFTVKDQFGCTPILAIARATALSNEYNRDVLHAVVDRIARCPMDMVDWSQRDLSGRNFISLAAQNQLLSTVWPEVRDEVAYFADNTDGIPLEGELWEWDWQALGEAEQGCFKVEQDVHWRRCRRSTAQLLKLSLGIEARKTCEVLQGVEGIAKEGPECDVEDEAWREEMRALVADGADVQYRDLDLMSPLCRMLCGGYVEEVRCLLQTNAPVVFSVPDSRHSHCPLHAAVTVDGGAGRNAKSLEVVAELLRIIADRVASQPNDTIDWACRDPEGDDVCSTAAMYGCLSAVVQVGRHEKQIPFFMHRDAPMRLTLPVCPEDVELISEADRRLFWPADHPI